MVARGSKRADFSCAHLICFVFPLLFANLFPLRALVFGYTRASFCEVFWFFPTFKSQWFQRIYFGSQSFVGAWPSRGSSFQRKKLPWSLFNSQHLKALSVSEYFVLYFFHFAKGGISPCADNISCREVINVDAPVFFFLFYHFPLLYSQYAPMNFFFFFETSFIEHISEIKKG